MSCGIWLRLLEAALLGYGQHADSLKIQRGNYADLWYTGLHRVFFFSALAAASERNAGYLYYLYKKELLK